MPPRCGGDAGSSAGPACCCVGPGCAPGGEVYYEPSKKGENLGSETSLALI